MSRPAVSAAVALAVRVAWYLALLAAIFVLFDAPAKEFRYWRM